MKIFPRAFLLGAAFSLLATLGPVAIAQEQPPAAAAGSTVPAEPAPAAPAQTSTTTAEAPASDAPAPATIASDTPAVAPSAAAPDTSTAATTTEPAPATETPATAPKTVEDAADRPLRNIGEPGAAVEAAAPPAGEKQERRPTRRRGGGERVGILSDANLGENEEADAVVAILGDATSAGRVSGAVVAVLGDARATGPVHDQVVAVLGDVYVNSKVGGVVAVLGDIELGPDAVVNGEVVPVGGALKRHPSAVVNGRIPAIGIGCVPEGMFQGLRAYFSECVRLGRPLAIGPHLGWAWAIAVGFLIFYALLALLFRGGIEKCSTTLETRPGGTFLAALITVLLTPVLVILLVVTVAGIPVLPFLVIGLIVAKLFGKAVILAFLGRRITRLFGDGVLSHPAIGVLVGGVIILALYNIPVVGFITYKLFGFMALGVTVYTLLLSGNKPKPAAVAAAPVAPGAAAGGPETVAFAAGAGATVPPTETIPPTPPGPSAPLPAAAVASLPRAGFWIRLGALVIDGILVGVVLAFLSKMMPFGLGRSLDEAIIPILAIYGALLWKMRGTTVGGIICGLRVVRLDGRPMDWPTAVIRALGCFVSLIVVGLGFIWVAFDDEKQSWHDKIAGTTVVHSRGQTLV